AMGYSTKDVLETMKKESGLRIKELKVDGGAVANNFLCQFQADLLGIKILRPKIIETTSLGAAYLAGLAVGFWKNSMAIEKFWASDRSFKPKMAKAAADKLYLGWQKAIKRTTK
ncbi:MAG: FGGY-family carbohydrate kinase, partial [Candidatus Margulisiibacteriota bacterium]